jgi:geranylgeranyl pyrophosphate synthase
MIYALSHLSGNTNEKRDSELIKCLEHLHIAFQCKDDIDDFLFDLENEQHTYAHI